MNESIGDGGIPSNPVVFQGGEPLPPDVSNGMYDSQNLWHSLVANREWVGRTVLGLYSGSRFVPASQGASVEQQITEADEARSGDPKYTDRRNLESFETFVGSPGMESMAQEFSGLSVLEIGSGAGLLSGDLRQVGASVTELDFSVMALSKAGSVSKLCADGTILPIRDGAFDRSISMFSTSIYPDTAYGRLHGLTEMIRTTNEGGRAFVVPLFASMMSRGRKFAEVYNRKFDPAQSFGKEDELELNSLRQSAAMDHVLIDLLESLIVTETVDFTPVLIFGADTDKAEDLVDCVSGIFDVKKPLTKPKAEGLVARALAGLY